MRKTLLFSAIFLTFAALRAESVKNPVDPYRISVMGSSVANGEGAGRDSLGVLEGYAYRLDDLLARRYADKESPNPFYLSNISVNGNSSVDLLARIADLENEPSKWVVFGISLGNEGIHGADDQQAVYDRFRNNMLLLIQKARDMGKTPIVMNNYTRLDFDDSDYDAIKKMNREISFWDVPSVNLFGAIDDGKGRWAPDAVIPTDIYHPNSKGHEEFFHAIVPSMMDALAAGKPLIMERAPENRCTLPPGSTFDFMPDGEVHSFTLAFSAELPCNGILARIPLKDPEGKCVTLENIGDSIVAVMPDGRRMELKAVEGLNTVELSQNFIRRYITLTVDGESVGLEDATPMIPLSFSLGNPDTDENLTLGEVMFYRSSMQTSSPFTSDGLLDKSSLELYVSMDEELTNKAMSTIKPTLNFKLK